jgi:hypothetical protein
MISGFCRDAEIYALLRYYATSYRRLGQPMDPIFKGKEVKAEKFETPIKDYHSTRHNVPEEHRSRIMDCLTF